MVRLLLVSGSEALTGLVQSIGRLNIRLTYLPRFQVALQCEKMVIESVYPGTRLSL
jgi:hypothetical protein